MKSSEKYNIALDCTRITIIDVTHIYPKVNQTMQNVFIMNMCCMCYEV